MTKQKLHMYVIYKNPTDFPGQFVSRRHSIGKTGSQPDLLPRCIANNLKDVRDDLPQGLVKMPRDKNDDACIVETWI